MNKTVAEVSVSPKRELTERDSPRSLKSWRFS